MGQRLNDNEIAELRVMLEILTRHYGIGTGRKIAKAVGTTGAAVSLWMRGHKCSRCNFNKVKKLLAEVRQKSGMELGNGLIMITKAEAKALSDAALSPEGPTDAHVLEWLADIDKTIRDAASRGQLETYYMVMPKRVNACNLTTQQRAWSRRLARRLVTELNKLKFKASIQAGPFPGILVDWR